MAEAQLSVLPGLLRALHQQPLLIRAEAAIEQEQPLATPAAELQEPATGGLAAEPEPVPSALVHDLQHRRMLPEQAQRERVRAAWVFGTGQLCNIGCAAMRETDELAGGERCSEARLCVIHALPCAGCTSGHKRRVLLCDVSTVCHALRCTALRNSRQASMRREAAPDAVDDNGARCATPDAAS